MVTRWLVWAWCICSLAHAKPVEGVVVKVGEGEVVVDLGTRSGIPAMTELQVFRRLVVVHPVTEKPIEDRFPIGTVQTAQVGDLLTIVTDLSGLSRPPEVGDYVVAGTVARSAPVPQSPATDSQTAAVQAAVIYNLGRPIDERIAVYEAVLRSHPEGPHTDAVGGELQALRALRSELRKPVVVEDKTQPPSSFTVRHRGPKRIVQGQTAQIAVAVVEHEWVVETRALVRRKGVPAWQTVPLVRQGDYHYRGELPAALTDAPGTVEYAIEAVRSDAVLEAIAGTVRKPLRVSILPPPVPSGPPGSTRLTTMARYVDFNTGGEATDQYFQFEAGIEYRVDWRALRAVRFGVGTIDGEGGPTEAIDAGAPTRTLNVNYAYAEAEVAPSSWEWVGVALRLMGGNHRDTADSTSTAVTGAEGRLRIGRADETRLVLGASGFQDLGNQAFTDLHITVFDRLPVLAGVAVTNLPVDEDLGVRLYTRVGYEALSWLTVLVEGGWNARTINHNGFTGGGGLALNW